MFKLKTAISLLDDKNTKFIIATVISSFVAKVTHVFDWPNTHRFVLWQKLSQVHLFFLDDPMFFHQRALSFETLVHQLLSLKRYERYEMI